MRAVHPLILFLAVAGSASADLLFVGAVPSAGAGLGPVRTVLSMQELGQESGCVAAGVGGATVTGAAACASGIAGGNEVPISQPVSAASLGLTDFGKLQVIFI